MRASGYVARAIYTTDKNFTKLCGAVIITRLRKEGNVTLHPMVAIEFVAKIIFLPRSNVHNNLEEVLL